MNKSVIAVSTFVRRQTPSSQFSHWTLSDEALIGEVSANFAKAVPGYKDGVILVPVNPSGFYSNVVQMVEGDVIVGIYMPRQPGEEPRRHTFVLSGKKVAASRVDVVLYRHDVLAENNEQSSDAEWEIVSVNAEPGDGGAPSPMRPGTLMANHFQQSGGTATGYTPEQFQEALRRSAGYWKDKGDAAPEKLVPDQKGQLVLEIAAANLNERYREFMAAALYYREALIANERIVL